MSPVSTGWPTQDEILQTWVSRQAITAAQAAALADWLRPRAFWLAGNWDTQFVGAIQGSLENAQRSGLTFADWLPEAQRILANYGSTAQIHGGGDRWPPWYADLVFRNATQAGLAGGRYAHMFSEEGMREAPFVIYRALHDFRTRPTHAALDGKVFRKTDTAARRYFPPWEHNCRCFLRELDIDQLQEGGYQLMDGAQISSLPVKGGGIVGTPPPGWDRDQVDALVPGALRDATSQGLNSDVRIGQMDEPGNDPAPRAETIPRAVEELRDVRSIERAYLFDSEGRKVLVRDGDPSRVWLGDVLGAMKDGALLHNHRAGESFSVEDVLFAIEHNLHSSTVVGLENVFSLERPPGGWGKSGDDAARRTDYRNFVAMTYVELQMEWENETGRDLPADVEGVNEVMTRLARILELKYSVRRGP